MSSKIMIAMAALLFASACSAQGEFRTEWHSTNSGGGLISGGTYALNSSIGQSTASFAMTTDALHWVGFWAGEIACPVAATGVAAAKSLPDGEYVSLTGILATTSGNDFSDFFYIEEPDRQSGMRVATPGGPITDLLRRSVVNVIGTVGTTSEGERQFTGPLVITVGSQDPITPLGMPNISVGGGDHGAPAFGTGQYGVAGGFGINNVGLLVRTCGRVVSAGREHILIDDGSGTTVRVRTTPLSEQPQFGQYIRATGISSLYDSGSGRMRLLLPRDDGDIQSP